MQNKSVKELAGGGVGSAVGAMFIVLSGQFADIEWTSDNTVIILVALQAMWSFVRPYIPKPKGEE